MINPCAGEGEGGEEEVSLCTQEVQVVKMTMAYFSTVLI